MNEVVLIGIGGTEIPYFRAILRLYEALYLFAVYSPFLAWRNILSMDRDRLFCIINSSPGLREACEKVKTFDCYFLFHIIFNTGYSKKQGADAHQGSLRNHPSERNHDENRPKTCAAIIISLLRNSLMTARPPIPHKWPVR